MINKRNKQASAVYKGSTEVVKIYRADDIVYQKLQNIVNPYLVSGVFYHNINGDCERERTSNNNEDYDGIVVSDGIHVLRIGLNNLNEGIGTRDNVQREDMVEVYYCGGFNYDMTDSGILITEDPETAIQDFKGFTNSKYMTYLLKDHTTTILNVEVEHSPTTDAVLEMGAYLGAAGEWALVFDNQKEVNQKMKNIGGEIIGTSEAGMYERYFWTSTHVDNSFKTWTIFMSGDAPSYKATQRLNQSMRNGGSYGCVRPFYKVVPPEGVLLRREDGSFSTTKKTGVTYDGILVSDGEHYTCINITDRNPSTYFGGTGRIYDIGVPIHTSEEAASADYDGWDNTFGLLEGLKDYQDTANTDITGCPPAEWCHSRYDGLGYLPAAGEFMLLVRYAEVIESLGILHGTVGDDISANWTSSLGHPFSGVNTQSRLWYMNGRFVDYHWVNMHPEWTNTYSYLSTSCAILI